MVSNVLPQFRYFLPSKPTKNKTNAVYHFLQKTFGIVCLLGGSVLVSCETAFPQEISPLKPQTKTASKELKEYLDDLFQKGFAHREQIKSGQMALTNHLTKISGSGSRSSVTREITIAFDEERRRVDRRNVFSPQSSFDDVGCIGCYEKSNRLLLHYSNFFASREGQVDDVVARTAMSIYDEKQLEENELTNFWTLDFGFTPQYLAYFCLYRLPTKDNIERAKEYLLINTVGMLEVADVTIIDEEYQGIPCKKIIFDSKFDDGESVLNTLWITEEQGYSLRKHHLQQRGIVNIEELLEVNVALDESSGIWFPSAWHYERKDNGKLRISQDGTVKNVILNKPIPESLFDMKDIKILPAGVLVHWYAEVVPPPHEGRLLWDGNDIVSREIHAMNLIAQPGDKNRLKKMILINVVFLALIFASISWRKYRRLKKQD